MKKTYLLLPLVLVATLTGCFGEKTNTVEFYKKNETARENKIKECMDNPGLFEHKPNCKNAITAQEQSDFDSSKTGMPTIR